MRNFLIVLFFVAGNFNFVFSQSLLQYSALSIPDSLKKDADVVFHLDETEITINSPSKMTQRVHQVFTVLTENGMKLVSLKIDVDKQVKLDEASVTVYNQLGFEVKHYRKKDFNLEGMYQSSVLASDSKMYTIDIPVPEFPFTIDFEYTVNHSGFIDLPENYFGSHQESFIKSRYIVKVNEGNTIKYKVYNADIKPVIKTEDKFTVYTWEKNNQPVIKKETGALSYAHLIPWLDISPLQFEYDGYPGTMESWSEFGKWRYPFYTEENPFSQERIDFYQSLVKNTPDQKEKISTLYKYLQNQTRYVYIGYGIGGFKPFPASFVESKKYGDCKALSNYMKQLLQAVGIKSYTASVYAGKNIRPFDPEFVSNKSNHIILCVPLEKDTMWLECTSKQTFPGVLGSFTENRNAMLITDKGGVLVNTPVSKSINNRWVAKATGEIFEDGSSVIHSRIFVSGEFWDNIYYVTESKTKDQIKNGLVNYLGYKAPDEFEFKVLNDSADGHNIELNLAYYKYFDFKAGSKHFFPLRQYKLNDETIKPAETRKYEYLFDFPYIKTDSITYKLPANFKKESLPEVKEIKNEFVQYNNNVKQNEATGELTVVTKLELNKHVIPPKQFNEVANSFEAIRKDETQKLILKQE